MLTLGQPRKTMPYDHSRKAGNRGDVWKHSVLVSLADLIPISADDCHYVDCHAGAPIHELVRGGEWEHGIAMALRRTPPDCPYLAIARKFLRSKRYPAGWVFVANRLARRCQRVHAALSDVADHVAATYVSVPSSGVPQNVIVNFQQTEGFAVAANVQKADLVFLDPPFHPDAEADWTALATACRQLAHRGLPFLAWYPFYWPTKPTELVDKTTCSAWEVKWAPCGTKPSQHLKGCGMLVSHSLAPILKSMNAELRRISACLDAELLVRHPRAV